MRRGKYTKSVLRKLGARLYWIIAVVMRMLIIHTWANIQCRNIILIIKQDAKT